MARRSLGEKLEHLFTTAHPANRGPYSNEEIAEKVRAAGGEITANYVWLLRKGHRSNPTVKALEALAEAFGVPTSYFFDEEVTDRVDAQLSLLMAVRDTAVQQLALRAAGLSPESLESIGEIIDRVRELEGLPREPKGQGQ